MFLNILSVPYPTAPNIILNKHELNLLPTWICYHAYVNSPYNMFDRFLSSAEPLLIYEHHSPEPQLSINLGNSQFLFFDLYTGI